MESKTCEWCGCVFIRPKRLHHSKWSTRRFCSKKCSSSRIGDETKTKIIELYLSGSSSSELSNIFDVSSNHVLRILRNFGVAIRPDSVNKKLALNRPEVKEKMRNAKLGKTLPESAKRKLSERIGHKNANWNGGITKTKNGYIAFTKSPANGEHSGKALHVLIAEWKYGRKLMAGEHVHHKDRNKMNNHPDNLIILSEVEHAKLHTKDREDGKRFKQM